MNKLKINATNMALFIEFQTFFPKYFFKIFLIQFKNLYNIDIQLIEILLLCLKGNKVFVGFDFIQITRFFEIIFH